MSKYEWEKELKKQLSSLPEEEQKPIFDYYGEMFEDRFESGMSEADIIREFGNPYDVAQKILADRAETVRYTVCRFDQTDEEISSLEISYHAADLIVCVSEEAEKIGVSYPVRTDADGQIEVPVRLETENGRLRLLEEDPPFELISWGFLSAPAVEIEVPAGCQLSVDLKTKSGDITLSGLSGSSVTAETNAGNITLTDLSATELRASTDAGNVTLENISASAAAVSSKAGNITLSSFSAAGAATFNTNAGNLDLSGIAAETLRAEAAAGSITLERAEAKTLSAAAKTGQVEVREILADEITLSSNLGAVRGTIAGAREDFTVEVEQNTGSSNLTGGGSGDKRLFVRVNCGSIDITFSG